MEYKVSTRHSSLIPVLTTIFIVAVIWCSIWCSISQSVIDGHFEIPTTAFDYNLAAQSLSSPADSQENPAQELIRSIKAANLLVSGTSNGDDITAEERETWNRQNPCLSRSELIPMYQERKYAKKLPPNPIWDELLTEYSKLHRTCTQKVGNLTHYFLTKNVSTGCQFAVASVMGNGLGNKFLATLPSVLFAILTKRVLLIPSYTLVPHSTCEPFPGSSWLLDANTFPVPRFIHGSEFQDSSWIFDGDFFEQIDQGIKQLNQSLPERFDRDFSIDILQSPPLNHVHAVGVSKEQWEPSNRFYCSMEQTFYSKVTWAHLSGCIYSMPKLFASPTFRPILEALFPDKMVMTRLLRSVFLPADAVWDKVININRKYMAGADRRVGIQVRFQKGISHYTKMNDLVNHRIVDCSQQYSILPNISSISDRRHPSQVWRPGHAFSTVPPKPVVKVFIASLFSGIRERLSEIYVRDPPLTEEDVELVQITQNVDQVYNSAGEDQQAFAEVLHLSFSDQLLLTPCSTFGVLAQGYGALTPWLIEMREDQDRQLPSCQRSPTVESCDMATDKFYRCPHDPALNERPIVDVVPYINDCLPIDEPLGIQMITTFQS